ncbi:MAG: riboflavin synthase [Rhodospirillales bacterium]|nr:riboflavin synthase [Rhodospirillales bacterium]
MFTGIITDIGRVRSAQPTGSGEGEGRRFEIETAFDLSTVDIGASIACAGACMTVVDKGHDGGQENGRGWFVVEVSAESLSKTTLGSWAVGARLNLERAMRLGDELGGHIVSGHVDGVGELVRREADGDSQRYTFRAPKKLAKYLAPKGSITIDGVSLTVNEVAKSKFGINLIPHTQTATTLGALEPGAKVNLEIDMLARYVARLLGKE